MNLPPQILEIIGHLLACALATETSIPFRIDYKYFHLADDIMHSVIDRYEFINSLYPNTFEFRLSRQIYRIMKFLNQSKSVILQHVQLNSFYLKEQADEPEAIENLGYSKDDFFKIASEGSFYLRSGLRSVIPVDVISPKLFYELLFK